MPSSPILDILGLLQSNKNANWGQSALVNTLNTMNQANSTGLGLSLPAYQQALSQLYGNSGLSSNLLNSPVGGLGAQQQSINDSLGGLNPAAFKQSGLGGNINDILNYVSNNAAGQAGAGQQGLNQSSGAYSNLLGNNGQVNSNQQGTLDQLTSLLGGGGTNGDLKSLGLQAGANGGLNGYDSALQAMGNYNLQRNGYVDPNLSVLASAGQQGLQGANGTPGLTQTGATAEGTALGGVQNGGQTDTTRALQGIGTNFAGQQALLPTALVAGFAKDQAGQQAQKGAADFQAQALARGGGPGSTVANGAANSGLADFANNIDQSQANAFQNALTQQQGLNLQQQGQGAQMALGAGNLAAGQLGTYGSLLNNLEGTANQRYGIGGSLLNNATQGANASANTYGNLGVAGGQLGNQTLGIGQQALNNTAGNQLGAASGITGLTNSQLQALLGAGQGLNANAGTANNAYNSLTGNQLNAASLGNAQGNSYYSQLANLLGLGNSANQNTLNLNNNTTSGLLGLSGQGLDYARTGLSGQAGLFTQYAGNALNNQAGAYGAASQGIGGSGLGTAVGTAIGGPFGSIIGAGIGGGG